MANQDSGLIQVLGSGLSDIVAKQYYNISISLSGSGSMVSSGKTVGYTSVAMRGEGSMNVVPKLDVASGLIQMSGELSVSESNQNLVNSYVTMYGFLTSNINIYSAVYCSDLPIDFNTQMIESLGCSIKGESVELKRYRGDTYPVSTTLSKNGNKDTSGITFVMSTQINDGTIYASSGVVNDSSNGLVDFPLETTAVATSGSGVYDIQGNDGTYIYTYEKGVFTLLEDVTV